MAKGKELADFSMNLTTITFSPGPGGSVLNEGNFEGTATGGFGTVAGTATFVGGKSGTFSYCGTAWLDSGDELTSTGSGSYESSGKHHWQTQGVLQLSDGSTVVSEGEIDLAERSWTGKVSEWN
jgi:hypothetical protein